MSSERSLYEQAIEAFEAGNRQDARRLLKQVLQQDPRDASAWYYFAQLQDDAEKKREYLRRALVLDPQLDEARDLLDQLDQQQAAMSEAQATMLESPIPTDYDSYNTYETETPPAATVIETPEPYETPVTTPPPVKEKPYNPPPPVSTDELRQDVKRAVPRSAAVNGFAFPVPAGIPGAPERISVGDIVTFVQDKVQEAGGAFKGGKQESLDKGRASWWQIVLMILLVGLLSAVVLFIVTMIFNFRSLSLFSIIGIPVLQVFSAFVGVGAGLFLSHWFITTQRSGSASLLSHSYPLTLLWAIGSIANLVLIILGPILNGRIIDLREVLLFGFSFNAGGGTLLLTALAAVIAIATGYFMVQQLERLYPGASRATLIITAALMLIGPGLLF
jgi:hypothetical protein